MYCCNSWIVVYLKKQSRLEVGEIPIRTVLNFLINFVISDRRQQEAELKLIEEETARRVEEAIRKKIEASLNSEEIRVEIQRRLEEGRRRLQDEVAAQLEKEKEEAVIEAKRKEVIILSRSLLAITYI